VAEFSFVWRSVRAWSGCLLVALSCLCGELAWAQANALDGPASNTPSSETAADPALDEHVNRLASELRCLVCQNQTVADSQAPLAMQLKQLVREQLAQGASDQQVRDFMVQRYGDFVLYRPPVDSVTALLWGGPALLLLLGACLFWTHWRARRLRGDLDDDSALPDDAGKGLDAPRS